MCSLFFGQHLGVIRKLLLKLLVLPLELIYLRPLCCYSSLGVFHGGNWSSTPAALNLSHFLPDIG